MSTAPAFVQKWAAAKGVERGQSQEHFIDLCRLLGEPTPTQADPSRTFYTFEQGALTPDGDGFADVWLKGRFAWEYKGKKKDLAAAYKQVCDYREALGNPPLLVVCDMNHFEVHTNWTNTEKWIYRFTNVDLLSGDSVDVSTVSGAAKDAPSLTALQVLKALWENPEVLKPQKTTDQITQEAAKLFGKISDELRKWRVKERSIARFVTSMIFCMFATDVGLLPRQTFSEIIDVYKSGGDNKAFRKHLSHLFSVMDTGGDFMMRHIPHFNGLLFEDNNVPKEITTNEILVLAELDALNWADVEPSIFGTLFERVLDPKQRKILGAHYTSRADIELIVEPVLMDPLRREWEQVKNQVEDYFHNAGIRRTTESAQKNHIRALIRPFLDRLASIRVLDPACGSGNFLYVSLALLKALEKEVIAFAALHGITDLRPRVHPRQLFGIETNDLAHELASIVIWIGYLQWKHRNVMPLDDEEPILEPLDNIVGKDAILNLAPSGQPTEPGWPEVDVIVGNPPFLGGKLLRRELGDEYVDRLFAVWDGRVARESDLCCYWFEKGRAAIENGRAKRVGLLATQGIRGGANRKTLQRIKETGDIFYAQADRKWIQDGVAVRVSMVGFDDGTEMHRRVNDVPDDKPDGALDRAIPVEGINANLTSRGDLTTARRLKENLGISFIGDMKKGKFEITAAAAREMQSAVGNPNGRQNSDVLRRWVNGLDITRKPQSMWIVDFDMNMSEAGAAQYEMPFEYLKRHVKPMKDNVRNPLERTRWWVHARTAPDMRDALKGLGRYIATVRVAKHRLFAFLEGDLLADGALVAFARDDDYFFGVLHSRTHEFWALKQGTQLESRPRYTPTTCFETFPFPQPTQDQQEAIAEAARELNNMREGWLNPPTPAGGLPLTEEESKKRTLTNLYNQRPTWLANAHAALDAAVFAAYGWPERPEDVTDAEILSRLLNLNLEREPA
jgi:type II restriction/modification system DNA methylase subunit YeeA